MLFSNKSSLDDYIIGKQIGQGAYAVVRVGLHKPSNKKVAMKIYKKYKLSDPNRRKSVKREIKLMEKMNNQHIIKLYEVIDTQKYVILVMEYVAGGSLHGYLKAHSGRRLPEEEAKRVFKQVVEGIRYCHNRSITHRDIKLENLLLDEDKNIKIIDFGFSTCIPNDKRVKIFCGTPSYMAPEIVNKTEYCGPPADVWALGVLLFTMLCGCFPYRGATDAELYGKISSSDYKIPSDLDAAMSPEARQLIGVLFSQSAEERPSAKELLNHPWLIHTPLPRQKNLSTNVRAHSSQPQTKSTVRAEPQKHQNGGSPRERYQTTQATPLNNGYFGATAAAQKPSAQQASTGMLENQNILGSGNVINNNFNIINNFVGCPEQKPRPEYPAPSSSTGNLMSNARGYSAQPVAKQNNWMTSEVAEPEEALDEKIVQTIVTKLGYTEQEVRKYVRQDKNSFVGVLYSKLVNDQGGRNHFQTSSTSSHNLHDISAKLPI